MSVMILFASVEGQTKKIASFVEGEVRKAGRDVVLCNAGDQTLDVSFEGVDQVILAASVHERRHPKAFEVFVTANRKALEARDTFFLSVSLNAAFAERRDEAQDYLTEMKMRTGFTPSSEMLVAGAVRAGSYDYYEREVLRHVILQGRDISSGEEHEFTDWIELEARVAAFLS